MPLKFPLAVLALATACGRIGFDQPRDDAVDATTTACDPTADFHTPVPIMELDQPGLAEGSLRLAPDELSGLFWGYRGSNDSNLFVATRQDLGSPFTISTLASVDTIASETDPAPSDDGELLVFRRTTNAGDVLHAAQRTSNAPPTYMELGAISSLDSGGREQQGFLVGDSLYFDSRRSGGGDLYRSHRVGTTFEPPVQIVELATASDEGDPLLTQDELTIYFRSDRGGDYDIYTAARATTTDPFGVATLVPGVNSPGAQDGPSWLSRDGCRMYLTSNRAGSLDIYVSSR